MIHTNITRIFEELNFVLSKVNEQDCGLLINEILSANKIVGVGAGRVGMALKSFTMRLGHLGKNAWFLGDATVPGISAGDLLLVASGSGETQTIFDLVEIAKRNGARIVLVTGNPGSRMGKLADVIVKVSAPSKTKSIEGFSSIQPMTTLNEQCLFLLFDAIVLDIMSRTGETHDTMWSRHSNLE